MHANFFTRKIFYHEIYNDSEHAVKTKNAPFFMIFPNISFFRMVVTDWTGPLNVFETKTYTKFQSDTVKSRIKFVKKIQLHEVSLFFS